MKRKEKKRPGWPVAFGVGREEVGKEGKQRSASKVRLGFVSSAFKAALLVLSMAPFVLT